MVGGRKKVSGVSGGRVLHSHSAMSGEQLTQMQRTERVGLNARRHGRWSMK